MIPIVFRYAAFALIAMAGNLGTQWVLTRIGEAIGGSGESSVGNSIVFFGRQIPVAAVIYWAALIAGTGVGFIIKYVLDKKFIFYYKVDSFRKDFLTFALYSVMAVITTLIFWGVQGLFTLVFAWEAAKYLGGFIGLAVGYTMKYFLDRRFVFVDRNKQ